MSGMTITEFLLARIAEDEAVARDAWPAPWTASGGLVDGAQHQPIVMGGFDSAGSLADGCMPEDAAHIARHDPVRVLAECEAKRRIIKFHESWPVMVEGPPSLETASGDLDTMTYRMTRQIAWLTQQEYRARFGDEPPTAPMLAAMAQVYADHSDFREEWRLDTPTP